MNTTTRTELSPEGERWGKGLSGPRWPGPVPQGTSVIEIPKEEGRPFGDASGTDLAGLPLRSLLVASAWARINREGEERVTSLPCTHLIPWSTR